MLSLSLSRSLVLTHTHAHIPLFNYSDELVLTLGSHANLISVAYMPKISPLAPADCDGLPAVAAGSGAAVTLQTDVSWETDVPGMMLRTVLPQYNPPPGLKYLKSTTTTGSSSGSDGGGGGATTDKPPASITGKGSSGSGSDGDESEEEMDSSFMAFIKKYWYVMLPLILTNLISSPAAKEGEGKEGAGGAQGQGAAPSAVAAAAAAAESPKPASQRRGKRG